VRAHAERLDEDEAAAVVNTIGVAVDDVRSKLR